MTIKISKKIKGYSVQKPEDAKREAAAVVDPARRTRGVDRAAGYWERHSTAAHARGT